MKNKYDFHMTQLAIDILMKIAAVIVTSVATLNVAAEAFSHVEEPWLTIIQIGALLLIEGAFMASWLAIDTQRLAPMQLKVAWAITLIVIYIALLVISIENGEGAAGWAFRFVLAVMIGRSIFESGAYEVLRGSKRADRDVRSMRSVRRIKRGLAKKDAMAAMKMESNQSNYAHELRDVISRARIEAEHEAAMLDVEKMRERLVEQIEAKDQLARDNIQASLGEGEPPKLGEGAKHLIIEKRKGTTAK